MCVLRVIPLGSVSSPYGNKEASVLLVLCLPVLSQCPNHMYITFFFKKLRYLGGKLMGFVFFSTFLCSFDFHLAIGRKWH